MTYIEVKMTHVEAAMYVRGQNDLYLYPSKNDGYQGP